MGGRPTQYIPLSISHFEGRAPLVFAVDIGKTKNRRVVKARGGGPVYIAEPTGDWAGWVLHEEPELESRPSVSDPDS